jgi:hypothetical protein
MLHLSPERLAALADDEPTAVEAAHLASCAPCGAERAAYRNLLALSHREGAQPGDPLTSWTTLAADLRAEGLIGPPADPMTLTPPHGTPIPRYQRPLFSRGWMRAAAALLLVGAGAAAGRYSAGNPVLALGGERNAPEAAAPGREPTGFATVSYSSTTDAMTSFLRAQREMQQAAAYLAEREQIGAPSSDSEMYRARLAALDGMVSVSRAALYEAPADPVINQYYLATLGAREATMRQIGRTVPVGTQVTPY